MRSDGRPGGPGWWEPPARHGCVFGKPPAAGRCLNECRPALAGCRHVGPLGLLAHPPVAPKKTALPLMEKPSRDESDRDECEPIDVMRCKF
jgi:hypothetical protein